MKNKIIYFILALVILVVLLLLLYKPKEKHHYDYPNTITITNLTDYKEADTILYIMLNKVLKIDTVNINIAYNEELLNPQQLDAVIHYTQIDNTYNLFLNKKLSRPLKSVLAHEVIHLKQYYSGQLIMQDNIVIYNNQIYDYFLDYKDRPWEKDAFKNQSNILKQYNTYQYK